MKVLCFLIIAYTFFSCKKEDTIPLANNSIPSPEVSFQIVETTGSYWVYEWFNIDSSGNEILMPIRDSVYIVGDTIINGFTYSNYKGTYYNSPYMIKPLRDSSGYIVNSNGKIKFSHINFTDTLLVNTGSSIRLEYWMTKSNSTPVTVAAGTYITYDYQGHYYRIDGSPYSPCDFAWVNHSHYDQSTGMEISSQMAYYSSMSNRCEYMERRLVDFYITP